MAVSTGDLILVTGPSGVGKSTVTEELHQRLADNWMLWQSDRCSPRAHPEWAKLAAKLPFEDQLALEERMIAANVGAIASYLDNGWPVVAELAVMTEADVDVVRRRAQGRTMLIQLSCSPETLATHLQQRDTPASIEWAVEFYERWRNVTLPRAVRIDVDDITPGQVTDRILQQWHDHP